MSSITFTRQSGCDYDDTSTTNPALSGMVKVREAIGLKDKSKWDKEWRPIFINFIESSNMIAIDLTKEKAKGKQELLTKIWEFINLVRDDAASDVPDDFLETALFVLFSLLRAQVRSQVKEAPKEEKFRLTSTTPAPARPTPGSASTSEAKISPLTGQTTIMLRRTNQSSFISSLFACWSHLAVFPPPSPPTETLPDFTTGEISVLHQLLKHYKIWNDKESIYWIDPNGNPFELRGDLDFPMMVYAAYNMQEPTRAREIRVKGADTEPVLWPWSDKASRRDMSCSPIRVNGDGLLVDIDDPHSKTQKKSRRSAAPSTISHSSSLTIRGSARGRDEEPATGDAKHEQPPAPNPKGPLHFYPVPTRGEVIAALTVNTGHVLHNAAQSVILALSPGFRLGRLVNF